MVSSQVKAILDKYQINVKKHFGQNFLMDENIIKNICSVSNIDCDTCVIEIGPGLGFLTSELIKKAKKVLCYEIDSDMVSVISDRFKDENNLTIKQMDFLKAHIDKDILDVFGPNEKVILVANLPYYITTAILLKILEESEFIKQMTCMMQTEVAQRICGTPSTKDYNSLSVLMQYYANATIALRVKPSCFFPEPNVESAVALIKYKEKPSELSLNEAYFKKFNRAIFSQRRKTLSNNLKNYLGINKEIIDKCLIQNNIDLSVRAEALSVSQIVKLSNSFFLELNK